MCSSKLRFGAFFLSFFASCLLKSVFDKIEEISNRRTNMDFFKLKNSPPMTSETRKETVQELQLRKNFESIIQYFHSTSPTEKSPYQEALKAYRNVCDAADSEEDLIYFLTSDIIFTALHTTVIEELFSTIIENQEYTLELIEKFSEDTQSRDELINEHTTNHLLYLQNGGFCEGCDSCEGHQDLSHLVPQWERMNLAYFTKLFLEVQTIFCFLERITYDLIPKYPDIALMMTPNLISQTRLHLAEYISKKLSEV